MIPHSAVAPCEPTKDCGAPYYFISAEGIGQAIHPANEPHTHDDPEAAPALEYPDQALYGHPKQIYYDVEELPEIARFKG